MRHAGDPNELLEVAGDELRPIVRDDPRTFLAVHRPCSCRKAASDGAAPPFARYCLLALNVKSAVADLPDATVTFCVCAP